MMKGYTEKELKIAAKELRLNFGFIEHFIVKLRENRGKYAKNKDNTEKDTD